MVKNTRIRLLENISKTLTARELSNVMEKASAAEKKAHEIMRQDLRRVEKQLERTFCLDINVEVIDPPTLHVAITKSGVYHAAATARHMRVLRDRRACARLSAMHR